MIHLQIMTKYNAQFLYINTGIRNYHNDYLHFWFGKWKQDDNKVLTSDLNTSIFTETFTAWYSPVTYKINVLWAASSE